MVFFMLVKYEYNFLRCLSRFHLLRLKASIAGRTWYSTNTTQNYSINISPKFLKIKGTALEKPVNISELWLRDHCRCATCFNSSTFQRNPEFFNLTFDVNISEYELENDSLTLFWSDGHMSKYDIPWVLDNISVSKTKKVEKVLWNSAAVNNLNLEPLTYDQFDKAETVKELYRRFITYGFAKVEGVPVTREATNAITNHICRVSTSFYGGMWEIGTTLNFKDTGYLNVSLDPHTDNTYFTEAQAVMLFHCIELAATGGDSILVDGFYVANQLKEMDPEAYNLLSNVASESEFIDNGIHYKGCGTTFLHHPITKELEQIRFESESAGCSSLQGKMAKYHHLLLET